MPTDAREDRVDAAVAEFLAAAGRPFDQSAWLARYPDVAAELAEFLADEAAFAAVAAPIVAAAPGPETTPPPDDRTATFVADPPARLGEYRIVREIGHGGMGVVYEAVQESLGRHVALKVLLARVSIRRNALERFKREARAAARLHHTNIVPVFGVGHADGVHYYAMQLITGQGLHDVLSELRRLRNRTPPLTDSALTVSLAGNLASGRFPSPAADPSAATECGPGPGGTTVLSSSSELIGGPDAAYFQTVARLGAQAADALAYAHAQGVVHRDVKPANLLLDTHGTLWVTDFGLAQVEGAGDLTTTGDVVGTLRYMAPERFAGKADARSDIYGLGLTLYELLTLRPAFDDADRPRLIDRIRTEDPPRARSLDPRIPRDLDLVVRKAIARDPDERYSTAADFAGDLGRFLRDEPVRARRPTLAHRFCKWARRNRNLVAGSAAMLVVALAVAGTSIGWSARNRAAQRTKLNGEVEVALAEAVTAREQALTLVEVPHQWEAALAASFSSLRRAEALADSGGDLLDPGLRQRIQEVAARLEADEIDRCLVADTVRIRLEQSKTSVTESRFAWREAAPNYRQTFAAAGLVAVTTSPTYAAAWIGGKHPPVQAALIAALDDWLCCEFEVPTNKWIRTVLQVCDRERWRSQVRAALWASDVVTLEALAEQVQAQPPVTLVILGDGLRNLKAYGGAIRVLQRAQDRYPGDFWVNLELAHAYADAKPPQYEKAITYYQVALALRPDSAGVYLNFGRVLRDKGDLDGAIAAFEKAIALNPDYGAACANLSMALQEKEDVPGTIAASEKTIAACRKAIALNPEDALAHNNLGNALWAKGDLVEGMASLHKALAINPNCVEALNSLGSALNAKGDRRGAEAAFRKAISLQPDDAKGYFNLGVVLKANGDLGRAIAADQKAIALNPNFAVAHSNLGNALRAKGDLSGSEAAHRKALAISPNRAHFHCNLSNTLADKGDLPGAEAALRNALDLDPNYAEAHCNLGHALRDQGAFRDALAALRRGHELGSRTPGWSYPSGQWVKDCQHLIELDEKLPAVLRGENRPADAEERILLARLCAIKKLNGSAARFYAESFAAKPELAAHTNPSHRYNAACVWALAGCGQGQDASRLDDKDRARWRVQALQWLRAELSAWEKGLERNTPRVRAAVQRALRKWQRDPDLVGLRDPVHLEKLPEAEREAWRNLWGEVDCVIASAEE